VFLHDSKLLLLLIAFEDVCKAVLILGTPFSTQRAEILSIAEANGILSC
jgi:hypothetical protein